MENLNRLQIKTARLAGWTPLWGSEAQPTRFLGSSPQAVLFALKGER